MRGVKPAGPLVRPGYKSLGDLATEARTGVAAQIDRHPETRVVAYKAVDALGRSLGVLRGGYQMGKGLADAAAFAGRIANPLPDLMSGRPLALQEGLALGQDVGRYVANGIRDPRSVGEDVRTAVKAATAALVPGATPAAATTSDELARRFGIAMNQGELLANVAAMAVGGPLAKAAGKGGEALAVRPVTAAKYVEQGYSPEAAAYLAEPYKGMGSHWAPRRSAPPSWFKDSDFNVLKPPGISRGEMYELHGMVDPNWYGTHLPKRFGSERWRFSQSNLKRYGPLRRLYEGAPGPLKARVGGSGATAGSGVNAIRQDRDR